MKKNTKILFLTVAFFIAGALTLNAWTGPTSAPPGDNSPAPLNISGVSQTKTGSLYFPKWFDSDNSEYYLDPSETSKFNTINLGGEARSTWPEGSDGGEGIVEEVDTLATVVARGNSTSAYIAASAFYDVDSPMYSYGVNPYGTSKFYAINFGGETRTTWPDGGSGGMSASNKTSCVNQYCTGSNSIVYPVRNAYGRSIAWPSICYGDWMLNTQSSNWYSSCTTGWIYAANCDGFSSCPDYSGEHSYFGTNY